RLNAVVVNGVAPRIDPIDRLLVAQVVRVLICPQAFADILRIFGSVQRGLRGDRGGFGGYELRRQGTEQRDVEAQVVVQVDVVGVADLQADRVGEVVGEVVLEGVREPEGSPVGESEEFQLGVVGDRGNSPLFDYGSRAGQRGRGLRCERQL